MTELKAARAHHRHTAVLSLKGSTLHQQPPYWTQSLIWHSSCRSCMAAGTGPTLHCHSGDGLQRGPGSPLRSLLGPFCYHYRVLTMSACAGGHVTVQEPGRPWTPSQVLGRQGQASPRVPALVDLHQRPPDSRRPHPAWPGPTPCTLGPSSAAGADQAVSK